MVAILRPWALVVALTVSLAAAEARANPDVWVEATITVAFDDQRVSGLGVFLGIRRLLQRPHRPKPTIWTGTGRSILWRSKICAPRRSILSRTPTISFTFGRGTKNARVTTWIALRRESKKRSSSTSFSVALTPPLDPKEAPVTVSLFDRDNVVDFNFSDSAFLLVSGEMSPGCSFRVARGKGAQSGHPQPVTLACEG